MDLKSLNQTINNRNFSSLYFFYGEEDYLKEFYCNRIIQTVVDDSLACFNLFHYQNPPTPEELVNAMEQPPVMADYKVIYLNELDILKCDSAFRETLLKQLEEPAEFLIVLIRETTADKRSRLWNLVQKKGETIECKYPSDGDMRAFINREFQKRGKKISAPLIEKILREQEPKMHSVLNLIETVCAYLQDMETVSEQSLDRFIQKSLETVVFDLSEALVNRKKEEAYTLLNKLKLNQTKNPPQVLFSLLTRHISGLYLTTVGQQEGIPTQEIKKLIGKNTPDFVISKYLRQAKNIPPRKLETLIAFCSDMDYKLKSGKISDPYLLIDTLFLKFWDI